jgi:hypothetical protein
MIEVSEVPPTSQLSAYFYTRTHVRVTLYHFTDRTGVHLNYSINYMEARVRWSIVHYESYLDRTAVRFETKIQVTQ